MRKALPFLCFLVTLSLSAQVSLTSNYLPELGDTLFVSFADSAATVDLLSTGGPQVWDFNDLTTVGSAERVVEELDLSTFDAAFAEADFKIRISNLSTNYYTRTDGELVFVGNIGTSPLLPGISLVTPFTPPFVDRRAPLAYLDQFSSINSVVVPVAVDSLPQVILDAGGPILASYDSIRLNTEIDRVDVVDAYGTLTVDGVTYDVIREKRTEIRDVKVEAKLGFFPWADVTFIVLQALPDLGDVLEEQDTLITYNFYNDDYVEPIATVVTTGDGESVIDINFRTNRATSSVDDGFISANHHYRSCR
ncbi:MAG: hypothetical protein AAF828_13115 [Bacteroidota bacterium]